MYIDTRYVHQTYKVTAGKYILTKSKVIKSVKKVYDDEIYVINFQYNEIIIMISTPANLTVIAHSILSSIARSTSHLVTQCSIHSVASSTAVTTNTPMASKSTILPQKSLRSYGREINSNKNYANDIHVDRSIVNQIHLWHLYQFLDHLTSFSVYLTVLLIGGSVVKFISTKS